MAGFADKWTIKEDPKEGTNKVLLESLDSPGKTTEIDVKANPSIYAELVEDRKRRDKEKAEQDARDEELKKQAVADAKEAELLEAGPTVDAAAQAPAPVAGLEVDISPEAEAEAGAAIVAQPGADVGQEAPSQMPTSVPQTTSSEQIVMGGTSYDPAAVERKKTADERVLSTQENIIKANEDTSKQLAAEAETNSIEAQWQANETRVREHEMQKAGAEKLQDLEMMQAKVAEMRVDPSRFYGDGFTGRKIGALVSIALSGIGAAMQGPGAKNMALEIMQTNIDRDIAVQKANIAGAHKGLEAQRGIFKNFLDISGDARIAEAQTQKAYWKAAQARINSILADNKSPENRAKGDALLAQIGQKIAQSDLETQTTTWKNVNESQTKQVPLTSAKEPDVPMIAVTELKNARGAYERTLEMKKFYENPENIKDLKVGPIVGRVQEAFNNANISWDPKTEELNAKQSRMLTLLVKAMSGAAASEKEMIRYEKIIPDIKDDPDLALAKLKALSKDLEKEYMDTYRALDDSGKTTTKMRERHNSLLSGGGVGGSKLGFKKTGQ